MNTQIVLFRLLDELNNESKWKPLESSASKYNLFAIETETLSLEECNYGTKLVAIKEQKSEKNSAIS